VKLIILASGKGSRLNQLTKDKPKCLVEVNGKTILSYQKKLFSLFNEVIVVVGYKKKLIIDELKSQAIFVENKNYYKTNMVHSLFCPSKLINEDIIFIYSDIIFDKKIIQKLLNKNKTIIPLNYDWLKNWKKRMPIEKIYEDAEDVNMKYNKLKSIGNKIRNGKLPKMQYMGIMRINNDHYHKMHSFYKKIKNKNIDFTSFINLILKKNLLNISYTKNNTFWTEIDSENDLRAASKLLKKIKLKKI
jgi:choline kinase